MIKCTLSNYSMTIRIDEPKESASAIDFSTEGVFLTYEELEQREREAYNAALETLPLIATDKGMRSKYEDADDYLKQRK